MAKSKNNVLTYGLSGKIGDLLVFRQRDGITIVSKMPEQQKTVSAKQKANRERFQQAAIYAKIAVEEGYSSRSAGNLWIYTATQDNESLDGDRILITASGLPGNIVTEERSI
jgi:hypothetical protein